MFAVVRGELRVGRGGEWEGIILGSELDYSFLPFRIGREGEEGGIVDKVFFMTVSVERGKREGM